MCMYDNDSECICINIYILTLTLTPTLILIRIYRSMIMTTNPYCIHPMESAMSAL